MTELTKIIIFQNFIIIVLIIYIINKFNSKKFLLKLYFSFITVFNFQGYFLNGQFLLYPSFIFNQYLYCLIQYYQIMLNYLVYHCIHNFLFHPKFQKFILNHKVTINFFNYFRLINAKIYQIVQFTNILYSFLSSCHITWMFFQHLCKMSTALFARIKHSTFLIFITINSYKLCIYVILPLLALKVVLLH